LLPLRRYVEARKASEVFEYIDRESSGKDRPQLNALMADARKRLFECVVIVRFDRFARSTKEMLVALEEFRALGISFVSLNEAIDTDTPLGKFFFTVVSAFGELERNIIRDRVRAGVERARAQGKRLGRPTVVVDREKIRRCAAAGQSIKSIATECGIARATVRDILGRDRVAENPAAMAALSR
jgi:DNA invertase Pin-like site-specific DNA recombinase